MQARHRLALEHERAADQDQAEPGQHRAEQQREIAGPHLAGGSERVAARGQDRDRGKAAEHHARPEVLRRANPHVPALTPRRRRRDQIGCGLFRQWRRDDVASRACGRAADLDRLGAILYIRGTSFAQQVVMAPGFIEQHGLWSDDQRRHAEELKYRIEKDDIQLIRVAWADPHGASRAKAVTVPAFLAALTTGYNINVATTTLDSANARTFASFTRGGGMGLDEMTGSPNLTIVPDPGDLSACCRGRRGSAGCCATNISTAACRFISRRGRCCAGSSGGSPSEALGCVVGLEIEWYLLRVADAHLDRRAHRHSGRARPAGQDRAGRARLFLSLRIQHGPDAAGAVGARRRVREDAAAAAVGRERMGAGPARMHVRGAAGARGRRPR